MPSHPEAGAGSSSSVPRKADPSVTTGVHLDQTRWFGEVKRFLEASPNSSLFAVVQEVLPDFGSVPPETRAHFWFWLKNELHSLSTAGILTESVDDDYITIWSIRKSGATVMSRSNTAK
jgi:hypothetical protein